jgi:hypothetical protein
MQSDSVALQLALFLGIILAVPFLVFYATYAYLNLIPNSEMNTINFAVLTASSILFGFATQTLVRFSDKITDLKYRMSDTGKELIELYSTVKKDKELSTKVIFYASNTAVFKGAHFAGEKQYGEALDVIKNAYSSIIYMLRWNLKNVYGTIITLYQAVPVGALISSIVASLFAFAPSFTHTALIIAMSLLLLSTLAVVVGYYYSSKWLNGYDDSIFNIRQQIIGELTGILPDSYKPKDYDETMELAKNHKIIFD